MIEVIIPGDFWDDDSEGSIAAWFFSDGDTVQEGDLIAEVMNEKVATELLAPASGILQILVEAEVPVSKLQAVARIG